MINTVGACVSAEWRYWITTKHGVIKNYKDWYPNLILDCGIFRMLSGYTPMENLQIVFGDGDTEPSVEQTYLDNETYLIDTDLTHPVVYDNSNPAAPFGILSRTIPTGEGPIVISEMGLPFVHGSVLFNRVLILDDLGAPSSITKQPGDSFTVECKVTFRRSSETASSSGLIDDGLGGTIDTKSIILNAGLYQLLTEGLWTISGAQIGTDYTDPIPTNTGCIAPVGTPTFWWQNPNNPVDNYRMLDYGVSKGETGAVAIREVSFSDDGVSMIRSTLSREFTIPSGYKMVPRYKFEISRYGT